MADEQEQEDQQPAATEEKPSAEAKPDVEKLINEIRAENENLRGQVAVSAQQAGEARQYVGALLAKIQDVAAKRTPDNRRDQFDEDPESAVDAMFKERVAPIVGEYLQNTARANRVATAKELGDNWVRYEREIDEFMSTMPLDVQAKPGAWESAYRYVLAGHLDEEMDRRDKVKKERAAQAESVGGQRTRSKAETPLDPVERELMRAFGLNEKEWREYASDEIERVPPSRDRRSPFAGRDRGDGS